MTQPVAAGVRNAAALSERAPHSPDTPRAHHQYAKWRLNGRLVTRVARNSIFVSAEASKKTSLGRAWGTAEASAELKYRAVPRSVTAMQIYAETADAQRLNPFSTAVPALLRARACRHRRLPVRGIKADHHPSAIFHALSEPEIAGIARSSTRWQMPAAERRRLSLMPRVVTYLGADEPGPRAIA